MLSNLKAVYDKLPKDKMTFLKYIPDRVLFGKSYNNFQTKVSFDKQLVDQNLFNILNYSRENTAFGQEHIPKKMYLDEVKQVLAELPLTSSADLSSNLDYYTSKEFQSSGAYLTTTGGTGRNPTSILLSNESFGIEWAHMHNIWSNADYQRKRDLKLTLRGKSLRGGKLIEYNPVYNELVVDTFKVKDENFSQFIDEIKKYPITHLHGYPSLVKEFMHYFQKYDYVPDIKGIFLGSEGATVEDKKSFSEFFDAKIVHWYGQSEKVTLAVDADMDGRFKVYTSYGYPRVVDGELVATSFVNRALPLINYKTGDSAEIVEDEHSIYLQDLKGRWGKDFVYLNQNKKIPTSSINLHSKIQNEILFYQIVQKEFGKLLIRVLPKDNALTSAQTIQHTLEVEMKNNLQDFHVEVAIVTDDAIQRSVRGKMIMLVQELKV